MEIKTSLINRRIGYWQVLKIAFVLNNKNYWRCKCERCGNVKAFLESFLRSGRIPVCRCRPSQQIVLSHIRKTKAIKRGLYREWSELVRKFNSKDKSYKNWGGAGLKLCAKWQGFAGFREDMQQTYELGRKLYIKDVPKLIYEKVVLSKEHCVWASTRKMQDTVQSLYVDYYGKKTPLSSIYNRHCIDLTYNTAYQRIARYKWDVLTALKTPPSKNKKGGNHAFTTKGLY